MSKKKHKLKGNHLNKKQLSNNILGLFTNNPKSTFNYKQISKQIQVTSNNERILITEILNQLKNQGNLEEIYTGKFRLKSGSAHVIGKVELASAGYGFVSSESLEESVFISQNNLNHALHGDIVKVYCFARRKAKGLEGEVISIIERAREIFVGVIEVSSRFAFLSPDNRNMPFDIFIPIEKLNGAKDGQKAVAKLTEWPKNAKNPFGEIIEILGNQFENDTEMHAILTEFGLPYRFSEEINKEAETISDKITEEDYSVRLDFRNVPTFTIDPEDAKDFDDALSIRKLDNGNWEAGIHIADVTHYIKEGSLMDEEAVERATSIYLVDRTIPMLPERISNNICSLRPNEEKLCYSAVFELNSDADIINEWFGRTIIFSNHRFSYQEAQKVIDTEQGDMKEEILVLHDLAQKLRKDRFKKGAISLEREEVKFDIDENGKPLRVYFREYGASNELIEEFMLLANKRVANKIGNVKDKTKSKTFVYRIHDKPNLERLLRFSIFIKKFGHEIRLDSPGKISTSLNNLIASVKGKKEQAVVENLALRVMAKAIYSTDNIGHYGLGFDYYTHFTSPIRRYPDMMVHRLLTHYLLEGESENKKRYEKLCKHSSDMEQLAAEAERASVKYKQVEFMMDKVGQIFEGIISGVTEWGIYVELIENKCEGLVHIRNLSDDFYEYDEDNYCIVGRHSRRKFQLGDPIKIKIEQVNMAKKQMDFLLAGDI